MKILKPKNILSIIYCILLSAPFLSIAVRCGYTMVNKNAYQSYSDNSTQYELVNDYQDIDINKEYFIQNGFRDTTTLLSGNAGTNYININIIEVVENPNNYNFSNIDAIGFYSASTSNKEMLYYFKSSGTNQFNFNSNTTFKLKIQIINMTNDFISTFSNMKTIYQNGSTNSLDNVFDYSVNKFIENNNIGQIDLTSWFSDLFLSNQPVNSQYINFLNWYLNYAILVSCVNILFLVFMWFVNFARRLLEKSMNAGYDW